MAKTKTAYVCNECGDDFSKWQGQCGSCGVWNSLSEVRLGSVKSIPSSRSGYAGENDSTVKTLAEIDLDDIPRISTGTGELDRVLGGGLVKGSVVLIGGHPGAGKSTLLLQILCQLAVTYPALYVTGEESLQQVALRAQRLGLAADKLQMLSETNVEQLCLSKAAGYGG
jgi:DNA repair protein RadA/Sms